MEWKYFDAIFHRPILMDGTRAKWFAPLMRRRLPDGSWLYRKRTEDEIAIEQAWMAW
jgi:hypothetical protein